jgi:hypothetical protein
MAGSGEETMNRAILTGGCAVLALAAMVGDGRAQDASMSFFVTSNGPGDGADLGGLEGADAHCQALAEAAGAGGRTWRAYLGTAEGDPRDRIGAGPWHNAKGVLIAESVAALHGEANAIAKDTALTETGEVVNGRGDTPNRHDILTGANADGTTAEGMTCDDWTASGEGTAMVGHHDRIGLRDDAPSRSWNASHGSRGCSQEALRGTGGDGLFYCFAVD